MIALRLGGEGGGGLTKRIAREKEEKKRKIPKPENYERKNFNVFPVSKDLNTRTNSMTKDQ